MCKLVKERYQESIGGVDISWAKALRDSPFGREKTPVWGVKAQINERREYFVSVCVPAREHKAFFLFIFFLFLCNTHVKLTGLYRASSMHSHT